MRALLVAACCFGLPAADFEPPQLSRIYPLGGRAGSIVEVEILGTHLESSSAVEFDCADLKWRQTGERAAGRLTGIVAIDANASLGGHMLRVLTAHGSSTSLEFNVGQFPAVLENERRAIPSLPAEIYGRLDGAADSDTYWFPAKAGERWLFDLRAMEHGSAVEARMMLLDANGKRIAFNDDRDHYDENPLIEHTFANDGVYAVKLDQYRGPRGFTFGKNNAYVLRISSLPRIGWLAPLGARLGSTARFTVEGSSLGGVRQVYLTELRRAEYARMTYPHTIPIHFRSDPPHAQEVARIAGKVAQASDGRLTAEFAIPPDARAGLWRLWLESEAGIADGPNVEISSAPEYPEELAAKSAPEPDAYTINGLIAAPRERDTYRIRVKAGEPLHVWTLSTQLGGPYLDSVLTLRDPGGAVLAENDDVVAGWGGLLGNPDSSLFFTPKRDGELLVEVRDRLNRGGESYAYRLKVERRASGFQLFTTPENLTLKQGGTATLKVHLVREVGFTGEVEVSLEGMPSNGPAMRGKFRADQLFEPNADGADMIIPELEFKITAANAGVYPIRIFGKGAGGAAAEAHTATMIGPIYQGDWNFYRRPVPQITVTVID